MVSKIRLLALTSSFALIVVAFDAQAAAAQTAQARTVRPVSVVGDLIDISRCSTPATTGSRLLDR